MFTTKKNYSFGFPENLFNSRNSLGHVYIVMQTIVLDVDSSSFTLKIAECYETRYYTQYYRDESPHLLYIKSPLLWIELQLLRDSLTIEESLKVFKWIECFKV